MSKDKKLTLTKEEAATAVRIIRAGGWHRHIELSDKAWPKGKNPAVDSASHLLKKLEEFLEDE
jgi:hypothetical protein